MESGELLTSEVIAKRLGTSHVGMEKLLEACVGLNFLRVEKKGNKGLYGNTTLANLYLAKSSVKSQYYYMQLHSEVIYPCLQYLTDAVREGKSQIKSIYGPSAKDFFDALYSSEERMQKYFWALQNTWNMFGREVMTAFDLSHFQLICDLGGGGVLVVESILNDDRSGPLEAHFNSIKLLLNTDGKIRTLSEHNELFSTAGFKKVQAKKGRFYGTVLGRK
ncbi:hypothetical protein JD844_032258 [Phrynosoma platyrhinos]|uniref:Uncharacterized protein n=1 Tax=Phrynosoma platyrhinos TaxID=52577 RepID=A0ABQ7T4N2_PHRPL|nr:hypothetical protein JD844_032258 [Phrynosoma platyrhinos]